jgi:D-sedoheptulose 7-phosphate isomerase
MESNMKLQKMIDHFFQEHENLNVCRNDFEQAFQILQECYSKKNKVLLCGNGGSAADSEHIVGELMKGFVKKRKLSADEKEALIRVDPDHGHYLAENLQGALPAISLTGHPSLSTAYSNDVAPDMIFAQQLYGYGLEGDTLIGLSTSGNSKNVINAVLVAKARGLKTIAFTGEQGGKLKDLCDVCLKVPSDETYRIQEFHLPLYHLLCLLLEESFF